MATTMTWNDAKEIYTGICSNGREIAVTGTEWAETFSDGLRAVAENNGWDPEQLTEDQNAFCEETTLSEIDDADSWESLMGANPNIWYL